MAQPTNSAAPDSSKSSRVRRGNPTGDVANVSPEASSSPVSKATVSARRTLEATAPDVQRMIGPFLLEKRLGVGGMGVVYKAAYTKNGATCAVKVLPLEVSANKKLAARFDREMAILKKLKHPHIVKFYGGGEHDGQRFYAMEFIDGGTLEQQIKAKGRLSWEQVIEYGVQLCEALQYAHEHGIVHRDLKPANLFLGRDGTLRLGDFGIARDSEATALTATGATVGTQAYMAPEQITGKQPISNKTDLYALGCVLFEMLTGHPPFTASTSMEMLLKHINEPAPKVRWEVMDCPVFLEQVLLQLLEKSPDKRPHDALMVQVALEEVVERVAARTSTMSQMTAGAGQTAIDMSQLANAEELKKLLAKKKKKKKSRGPVWERSWFLSLCLLLLVGAVAFVLRPLSEESLFAKAVPLMQSEDPVQWQEAYDRYLKSLLERFPEGAHAAEARDLHDKLEMHRTERGLELRLRLGQDPKHEAERLYLQARALERFGDTLTAKDHYRALVDLLKDREQDRPYRNLARRELARLEAAGDGNLDRKQIVQAALKRAREQFLSGKTHAAEETWLNIIKLYDGKAEFEEEVAEAKAGRAGRLDREPR